MIRVSSFGTGREAFREYLPFGTEREAFMWEFSELFQGRRVNGLGRRVIRVTFLLLPFFKFLQLMIFNMTRGILWGSMSCGVALSTTLFLSAKP